MAFSFRYTAPLVARPGMVIPLYDHFVETGICQDTNGISAGHFVITEVPGITPRTVKRFPTEPAVTRKPLGFVKYDPGKPCNNDPNVAQEYYVNDPIPVVRRGRVWVFCETAIAEPLSAADSFWYRVTSKDGNLPGGFRHGDGDRTDPGDALTATCVQLPAGTVRAIGGPTGGAVSVGGLVLVEFDFTSNIAFG